jgi:hypothetical protein
MGTLCLCARVCAEAYVLCHVTVSLVPHHGHAAVSLAAMSQWRVAGCHITAVQRRRWLPHYGRVVV